MTLPKRTKKLIQEETPAEKEDKTREKEIRNSQAGSMIPDRIGTTALLGHELVLLELHHTVLLGRRQWAQQGGQSREGRAGDQIPRAGKGGDVD